MILLLPICGICQCERDILLRSQSLKGVLRDAWIQCDIVIRDLFLSQRKKWPGKIIFLTFQMNIIYICPAMNF